jgi:elongation factor 1 alpha-like protein
LGGQTREHAILVKSLGVVQLIVAINKMDMAGWSQSRFDHICGTLLPFLKQIGFKKDQVFFVPVSGFKGDNIIEPSENMTSWYTDGTLLHYLDNLMVPKRDISKPFRMPINDVFKSGMGGGILLDGRIESGSIQIGDSVCVRPINELGIVKGNCIFHNESYRIGRGGLR